MIFLDTSLVLETMIGQGTSRIQAQEALDEAAQIATTDAVLTELWNLLATRGHLHRATPVTTAIAERAELLTPTADARAAALTILREWADQPFSYCDALSFAVMEANGIDTVLTFDEHFAVYRYGPGRSRAFTVLP